MTPSSHHSHALHWWQRGVIYQIYPRSFKDTTGNGIGDLPGVIEKLDYLNDGTPASLGIDAIWLSPIYPSPMADFGYDVADYCDIHPLFGDLATFDRLVSEAHRRGIKIILDYVPNHTSDQHPWFVESRSSRDNPKRDWYFWRDPKPDGSPPNNWGSIFGGPAWTWDEATSQYYLHQFLKEQPELNWRNPEARTAMLDVLRFWLDRGVGGFRIDVIGMLIKDEQLRDNPPNPNTGPALPPDDLYHRLRPVYSQDQDEVHRVIGEIRRLLDEYGERCAIGEVWYEDLARWIRFYGADGAGLHLPFNFGLLRRPWGARGVRALVDRLEAALPAYAWPNYVLGNHDVPRLASRVGAEQARVATMLLLTLRGTPFVYYGDELGLENGDIPLEKVQDPPGIRFGLDRNRDVCRTPMQWDAGPNAGFSEVEPWLPVSADYATRNAAAQLDDPTSMLSLYRCLIWYRRGSPALQRGSYKALDVGYGDCFVYLREAGHERRLVALNFAGDRRQVSIPGKEAGKIAISTYLDRDGKVTLSELELRPGEGVIIEPDPTGF